VAPAGEEDEAEEEAADLIGAHAPAPAPVDIFGAPAGQAEAATGPPPGSDEFSDAVAVQLPVELREGVEKPYFLFGDPSDPVDIWYVDLARGTPELYQGRGSGALAPAEGRPPLALSGYQDGEWAVVFKRPRRSAEGISFAEETFVPVAFSVWDGFNRERGNKRALSSWFHVYLEPLEEVSPWGRMLRAGGLVLLLEILVIALVRRRRRRASASAAEGSVA
jgi:hypothetical protein